MCIYTCVVWSQGTFEVILYFICVVALLSDTTCHHKLQLHTEHGKFLELRAKLVNLTNGMLFPNCLPSSYFVCYQL